MFRNITRVVWIISIVSLFNDFSSEMLYPILPLYFKQIGYGTLLIGVLEGLAECIAGLTKIYAGSLSDSFNKRLPFVNLGYILSVFSRPLIAITSFVSVIFLGRSLDRIGKGIRTGARDGLLADECKLETRAEIFGFHRSMDTLGAILGPAAALLYLQLHPHDYKSLFFITLIPGLIAISCSFFIKEKKKIMYANKSFSIKKHFSFYKEAPKAYLSFLVLMLLFSLANSSDLFLLLRAKDIGLSELHVLALYMLFNLVYALFSFPIGKLADRYGKFQMLVIGFSIYSITYLCFGLSQKTNIIIVAFILYGFFYAFTQGILRALLIEKVLPTQKSSAIGFYDGLNSITLLVANTLAGFLWYKFGAAFMFNFCALLTLIVLVYMIIQNAKSLKVASKIK